MSQTDSKSSSEQKKQENAQASPNLNLPFNIDDSTIDIYELWIILWKRKWLIIFLTVVAALASLVYSFQQKPTTVYNVQSILLPPTKNDIDSLLEIRARIDDLYAITKSSLIYESRSTRYIVDENSPARFFEKFAKNLNLRDYQYEFFKKNELVEDLAAELDSNTSVQTLNLIISNLSVDYEDNTNSNPTNSNSRIIVSTNFTIPIDFSEKLDSYIEFVQNKTKSEILEQIRSSIQEEISYAKNGLILNQDKQNQFILNRLLKYEEAFKVAVELGIKERIDGGFNSPLYYRGYRALNVEMEFLKNRSWDLPHHNKNLELGQILNILNSIKIIEDDIQVMNIGNTAIQKESVISVNKKRIIGFSIVISLFLGIFLAFFVEFLQSWRKKHSS